MKGKVIDLGQKRYKRLVLKAFDDLEHKEKRDRSNKKAEVERNCRNKF